MDDEKKKVLIVDTEPASRRTLSGIVAGLMAKEAIVGAQPAAPAETPPRPFEQRVRERIAAIEAGEAKDVGRKELVRLRKYLGQGPRKEPRLEVAPGEELKLGGYVLTVLKVKRDGRLRVAWDGGRPNAGHVLSVKGWPYHVAWATSREVGLAPGLPPSKREGIDAGEVVVAVHERKLQPISLKKRWAAERARRNEGART